MLNSGASKPRVKGDPQGESPGSTPGLCSGSLCPWGFLSRGISVWGSLFGGLCQVDPCGQRDTCENITLPETSFAADKNTNERNVNVLIVEGERNADGDTELCFIYFCLSQTSFDEHGLSKVCMYSGKLLMFSWWVPGWINRSN